jgi:hypothetical protein
MITRELIRRHLDETTCDSCGCPLCVGDRVLYDLARGTAYCSRSCAAADQDEAPDRFDSAA